MKVNITAKEIANIYNADRIDIFAKNDKDVIKVKHKQKGLAIFISYSHHDEDIKERLDFHLSSLKGQNMVIWNDRQILPGTEWDEKIKSELENSDIILLLVSAHFITSNYIWSVELNKAIERHIKKQSIVIPIFCKPCDHEKMPFSKIQGLPKDAKPICGHENIELALAEVAKGISSVVINILNSE